MEIAMSFSTIF